MPGLASRPANERWYIMHKKNFFTFLLVLTLLTSFTWGSHAKYAHAEDTDFTIQEKVADTNKENISQIIQSVLENQEKILRDVETEKKELQKSLTDQIAQAVTLRQTIYNDFNKIYQVYLLNKNHPAELSLVAEQINRFIFQINDFYEPLIQIDRQVDLRLQQLNNLVESLETINSPNAQSMQQRAKKLVLFYKNNDARLEKTIKITKKNLDKVTSTYEEVESNMPRFWLSYYLHQKIDFFASALTWYDDEHFESTMDLIKVTFLREVPSSSHSWVLLGQSFMLILIPFGLLCLLAYKALEQIVPKIMRPSAKQILASTFPWIVLGISLQHASWDGGNRYQIINAFGTFLQCFGQISLAWQMLCIGKESSHKAKSPFLWVLPLLVGSFFLIHLTDISIIFSIVWAFFLLGMFYLIYKNTPEDLVLCRFLSRFFLGIIGVALFFIFITGHIHLSFFIILTAMCLVLGLHQAEACVHATTLLHNSLPQSGLRALFYGLLLAIALPIILTLSLLAPLSWLLAFPGGEYLIASLGNFNFSVGKLSFNALQVLSVATFFYLTKSIISVSNHYIDHTWSKNSNDALNSLATPIKTTIFFGFWIIFALYVLQSVGFDLSNIAVVAGGLSVGIGLGLQGIVQNTFSGFALIFGRNIREGDVVEVGTVNGIVQKVSLRATRVRTFDNSIVFIPNSEFMNKSFINWTHNGNKRRCSIMIGVAYDSDLALVEETILEVVKNDKRVAHDPEPILIFMDFAASSLNFEVRFWIYNMQDRLTISSHLRYELMTAFKERNIEIPFPQTDVHVKHTADPQDITPVAKKLSQIKPRRVVPRPRVTTRHHDI